jgi:NTE family protein
MRALVLSGGGSKGAFQVGVLKRWMGDQRIDYDIVCGVSVGALNTAGLAMTPKGEPEKAITWLEQFWLEKVETAAIYKRWFPFGRLHSLWLKSVYDSSPLISLVKDNLSLDRLVNNGRILAVGAVCLDTGEHRFARETDPNFQDWVLASSSFPVFLRPIEIEGKLWSDGGIKNVTPLGEAIRLGADEIDVIMCTNMFMRKEWDSQKKRAIPDQVTRAIDLMSDQIVANDIELCGLKNDLAITDPRFKKVKVRVVMPNGILTKDPLNFDRVDIVRMMAEGYETADTFTVYD